MADNVRCAGRYATADDPGTPIGTAHKPCGWTGRLDGWALAPLKDESGVTPPACPECGGRIELIHKEEPAADGAA